MNLDQLGITKEDLINQIVLKFIEKIEQEDYEEYAINIKNQVELSFNKKFQEEINKHVTNHINKLSEIAFSTAYQPIDKWGQPNGEQTTLKDQFEKEMQKWWDAKVDKQSGEKTDYGGITRAEYVVNKKIKDFLGDATNKAIVKSMEEARQNIHAQIQQTISNLLTKYFTPIK